MSAAGGLTINHLVGVVGVASLCVSAYLVGTLQGSKEELGAEVERSVKTGIQGGLDEALAPDVIEDRSAAVGRGMVDGVIEGAIQQATDRETRRMGAQAARSMLTEADAVAGEGIRALRETLAPRAEGDGVAPRNRSRATRDRNRATRDQAPIALDGLDDPQVPGDRTPLDATTRDAPPAAPTLAEDVGAVAEEAAGIGFDLLDAALGPPPERKANEEQSGEPRSQR